MRGMGKGRKEEGERERRERREREERLEKERRRDGIEGGMRDDREGEVVDREKERW